MVARFCIMKNCSDLSQILLNGTLDQGSHSVLGSEWEVRQWKVYGYIILTSLIAKVSQKVSQKLAFVLELR